MRRFTGYSPAQFLYWSADANRVSRWSLQEKSPQLRNWTLFWGIQLKAADEHSLVPRAISIVGHTWSVVYIVDQCTPSPLSPRAVLLCIVTCKLDLNWTSLTSAYYFTWVVDTCAGVGLSRVWSFGRPAGRHSASLSLSGPLATLYCSCDFLFLSSTKRRGDNCKTFRSFSCINYRLAV